MVTTNHSVTLKINGVDKTSSLLKDSIYIKLSSEGRQSYAEFVTRGFVPHGREEIEITIDGTVVFGGYVRGSTAQILGVGATSFAKYNIECSDWTTLLDTIYVTGDYFGFSDAEVVQSLFDESSNVVFDTATQVKTLDNDLSISFYETSLRDALNQLAKTVNASWFIAPDKTVYWNKVTDPAAAAFNISTTGSAVNVLKNSIEYSLDVDSIINEVEIVGGLYATNAKVSQEFTAFGLRSYGTLDKIIDVPFRISFTDKDSNPVSYYGSQIGYEPSDQLASDGGYYPAVITRDGTGFRVEDSSGLAPKIGTTVTIEYYYKDEINITVSDLESQSVFGIYKAQVTDETFQNQAHATKVAQSILDANAWGKETISFDILEHGLLPGTFIDIDIPQLGVGEHAVQSVVQELYDGITLENEDSVLLEVTGESIGYVITDVEIQPQITNTNEFLLVSHISVGRAQLTIVDSIATIQSVEVNKPIEPVGNKLSNISSNLGDVVLGKATFTDGGTAQFEWGTPNGATGIVIGLDDRTSSEVKGAAIVYQNGSLKAKLGRLDDAPAFGTITPSGWGLYTNNGYFSGVVAASTLIGGTIIGNYITGGTIQGNYITGGTILGLLISGGTINGSKVIGGTIATSTPPINSSNPGVYMDSTGLYGYGSAGLTFRLSSDPAIKPYFSSGTILNTVYEINTAAVLRTGTTNPRVQIDNSGIFAYDSGGTNKFAVDATTGKLTASDGNFQGTVSASVLTGNAITGGTINGNLINGGTVQAAYINGGTIAGTLSQSGIIRASGTAYAPWGFADTAGTTELHGHGLTFQSSYSAFKHAQGYGWINNANGHKLYTTMQYQGATTYAIIMSADFGTVTSGESSVTLVAQKGITGGYTGGVITINWDSIYVTPDVTGADSGLEVFKTYTATTGLLPQTNNTYKLGGTVGASKRGYSELWLASPNNTVWKVTVSNAGVLSVAAA